MQATSTTKPAGWLPVHDTFVKDLAQKGEDARSITILIETEYPGLQGRVAVEWIKTKMA